MKILCIFLILCSTQVWAQDVLTEQKLAELNAKDLEMRREITSKVISKLSLSSDCEIVFFYMIPSMYSSEGTCCVFTKCNNTFSEYYIDLNGDQEIVLAGKPVVKYNKKQLKLLKSMFDFDNYHRGFVYSFGESSIYSSGSIYFVAIDKSGEKYGENHMGVSLKNPPINKDYIEFILQEFMRYFPIVKRNNQVKL